MAMKNEKELIEEIREHLDKGIDNIDSTILTKIRGARLDTMEQKRSKRISLAVPLSGVAVSAAAILIIINLMTGPDNTRIIQSTKITENKSEISKTGVSSKKNSLESIVPPVVLGDIEINPDQLALIDMLSEEQEFDLLENLEFYTWVEESENTAG